MVNRKACLELADFIEQAKYRFDMTVGFANPKCGSAGCIGGHAAVLWPEVRGGIINSRFGFYFDDDALQQRLGLSDRSYNNVVFGKSDWSDPGDTAGDYPGLCGVTRMGAIRMLRRLARTRRVTFLNKDQIEMTDAEFQKLARKKKRNARG